MKKERTWGRLLTLLLLMGIPFAAIMSVGTPLYVLNDDLQIQSVLSGTYSGSPDLHTVYMRAPLSFLLSLLYRILPMIPWFGLFLCGTVFLCVLLILYKCMGEGKTRSLKTVLVYILVMLFALPLFWQPHYTVVAACAGATGIFLLLQTKDSDSRREQIRSLLPAFFMLLLCDQIRSQVFFMLLPFLGIAQLSCFLKQEKKTEWLKKQVFPWLGFVVAWISLYALHSAAYAGREWQDFLNLNEARTALYDYTLVWESDEAVEYYRECGVTEEAYPLYRYYDLLPETSVTTERLQKMADFQEPSRTVSEVQKLKNVIYDIRTNTLGTKKADFPYAYLLIVFYVAVIIRIITERRYLLGGAVCGSGLLHILLYGWLLWRGRTPERVMVSLYMIELFLLLAVLWPLLERSRWMVRILCAVSLIAAFFVGGNSVKGYRQQSSVNQCDDVIYSYMANRPQQLYLVETYATVDHTAPVFQVGGEADGNVLLMGGWLYGSPLEKRKLERFGYEDVPSLFTGGDVCCVFRNTVQPVLTESPDPAEDCRDRNGWNGLTPSEMACWLEKRFGSEIRRIDTVACNEAQSAWFHIYHIE